MKRFFVDSSHLGDGEFEARIFCQVEAGELFMSLRDGTSVSVLDLHADDLEQVLEMMGADLWARHKVIAKEFHAYRKAQGL